MIISLTLNKNIYNQLHSDLLIKLPTNNNKKRMTALISILLIIFLVKYTRGNEMKWNKKHNLKEKKTNFITFVYVY